MLRPIAALAALALSAVAFAQSTTTTSVSPATQQVQLLAPQLVAFSGSIGNFDSLVTGLTQGTPVTLATLGSDGLLQIVTFVPGTTLTPLDTARNLETARQNLITRGVATPTAQQLAVALVGGTLSTGSGSSALTGVLTGTATPTTPIQVRNELAASPPLGVVTPLSISSANLQALRSALAQGGAVTLTSADASGVAQNVTFALPRGPMSPFEVNLALQLATGLLAQQGITNPTPDQIRVALLGGTLTTAGGALVPVQGVLQGSVRNTSDTTLTGTSNSPLVGTSNTSANVNPVVTAPAPSAIAPAVRGATARGSGAAPVTAGSRRGG